LTDAGFAEADVRAAAQECALELARRFGLGDDVRDGDRWSVDPGDSTIAIALNGAATGRLQFAVNDVVGERLLADSASLQDALDAAAAAIGAQLGADLAAGTLAVAESEPPACIVEITDAGVVTALVGVTLPLVRPADPTEFDPISFEDVVEPSAEQTLAALGVLNDVELVVTAELGRTTMAVRELLGLSPGMVVEIDRVAGSPIDLLVNGRRIAAGEVVVIDEEFGIRITDIAPVTDQRR
jgi:flagellar motor switch protein FliN/FliY